MKKNNLLIVVIVDDPALSKFLSEIFADIGHDTRVFSNPMLCTLYRERALECTKETPCADVVIADQDLPRMTGLDFFKLQRERGCIALDINKAILVSSETEPKALEDIHGTGFKTIKKPFRASEIIEWVDECASREHAS